MELNSKASGKQKWQDYFTNYELRRRDRERRRLMKKVIISITVGIISLILLGLCIWWSISLYQQGHALWLNEYNAQIAQFGFYKEDILLLNQYSAKASVNVQTAFNIFSYIVLAGLTTAGFCIVKYRY